MATVLDRQTRLSQLDMGFGNHATAGWPSSQESRGLSRREPAETACGADQGPCETASGVGRLASCFYATSFPAKTAKSTAIGASWENCLVSGGRTVRRHVLYWPIHCYSSRWRNRCQGILSASFDYG